MHALIESDATYKEALESATSEHLSGINLHSKEPYLLASSIAWQDQHFSMRKFFQAVLAMGPSIVVVTNGQNGVYVATSEQILFHPSLSINAVNSVGAGDAFGSTFIASLATGNSKEDALRLGIINSASVLQKVGAKTGLLERDQLLHALKGLDKTLLQSFPMKNGL
jgi:fructose-1-phosphate kinase PfkB-like protein